MKFNFNVKIKNIGKLKDADNKVRPLTILAGPNNTGKTFVSKTLYSVFRAMRKDSLLEYALSDFSLNLISILKSYNFLRHKYEWKTRGESNETDKQKVIEKITSIIKEIEKIYEILRVVIGFNEKEKEVVKTFDDNIKEIKQSKEVKQSKEIINRLQSLKAFVSKQEQSSLKKKTGKDNITFNKDIIDLCTASIEDMKNFESIKHESESKLLTKKFNEIFHLNMLETFQVPEIKKLLKAEHSPGVINFQGMGKITLMENEVQAEEGLVIKLSELPRKVIYLESPFYWKLQKALINPGRLSPFSDRKSLLVPKYFWDLNRFLNQEWSGSMAFPEVFEELTAKTIKGKIASDASGGLVFEEKTNGENTKQHSLPQVATGIVQLGLLALLIEKKVLDKETVLFIDEPETNLHPAWQVQMMEILFKLVKQGMYVVMATHSADMLKWLEVHLKKNPGDKDLVALNEMDKTAESNTSGEEDIGEQLKRIKKNLTKPYFDLFVDEL